MKKTIYVKAKEVASQDVFKPATAITEEAIRSNITEESMFLKPKNATVKRVVNQFRAKQRPDQPKDLNFEINTDFLHLDEFLLADIKMDTCRHLVFSTPFQLSLLQRARRWFIDGTFKIVGQPFKPNGQLMTINAFVQKDGQKKQFPLVFSLMSRRRKTDYIKVLNEVLTKIEAPMVESFLLDFETGAWQAIRDVFPEIQIKGCVFHWTQAVYRHVQALGLATAYREQGPLYIYIKQLLALPFLPASHIPETFDTLKLKANTEPLKELTMYIERQWMTNETFPVEAWSIYDHTIRTNNDIEAWHRRLNCNGSGLSFYKLVPLLIREAKLVQVNVMAEDLETETRVKYTKVAKKLDDVWQKYRDNEITTSRLLKLCGRIYKTA